MSNFQTINTIVAKRADSVDTTTLAETTGDQPNIIVSPMHPLAIIAVRAARVYLQSVVALVGLKQLNLDAGVLPNEFFPLLFWAAKAAIASATMSALWNGGELLARIDEKLPKFRA